jgi:membrane-associated phospholipid phosphatase
MSDVTPPIKVSGVPLGSRASRRIKAGEGGLAERLAFRMQRIPALLVSWIVANAGAVLLATGMVGLGFFVTKLLLSSEAVADADAWLPRWLEEQRTPFLNDASFVTSHIADRWVLVPLVGIVVLSLVLRKRWRLGSFYLQAILAEILTYGLVTRFIERPRPEPVEQLDTFNLLHSYPSGHVAASVAIYGSLALLLAAPPAGARPCGRSRPPASGRRAGGRRCGTGCGRSSGPSGRSSSRPACRWPAGRRRRTWS